MPNQARAITWGGTNGPFLTLYPSTSSTLAPTKAIIKLGTHFDVAYKISFPHLARLRLYHSDNICPQTDRQPHKTPAEILKTASVVDSSTVGDTETHKMNIITALSGVYMTHTL